MRCARVRRIVIVMSKRRAWTAAGLAALILLAAVIALATAGPDSAERSTGDELLPPVDGRAVVWVVGDATSGQEAQPLADTVEKGAPDRVLYLGDVYERGTAAEFDAWSRVWGTLASRTAPTPGNHDWPRNAEGYTPYWKGVHGRSVPPYYSLRAGGWELLSLNSEMRHGRGSPQERWLAQEVADEPGDCRIAFSHRPRFNAGPHGDTRSMEALWRHLPGNARVLLSGHDHNLQRLRQQEGVVQFVVGAGGRQNAPLDFEDPRLEFGDDHSEGALRLVLEPGRLSWSFVSAAGGVLDSGRLECSVD